MNQDNKDFWFPGKWIGGCSLLLAPLLLLAGVLLRLNFHFFFPEQLEAYEAHPLLMTWSYQLFLAGNIVLWPGILTLVRQVGLSKANWARWGGIMVVFGLFARTFHAGVDHLAFQLVRIHDLDLAGQTIAASYGAFHAASLLTLFILLGWMILAIGAYLSGTMNLFQCTSLAMMSLLMIGVLKGSSWTSVVATAGLCIALVPFGIKVLTAGNPPATKNVVQAVVAVLALVALLYFFGQAG